MIRPHLCQVKTLAEDDLRTNIKEQTKYLPTTLWCPGGAWAIFMAENCRKLFPSATRQRRSCLEAIKIATFVWHSYSLVLFQPVTTVAASVFVLRTSSAPSDAVYVPLENSDKNDKRLDNVPEQRRYTLKKLSDWLLTGCFCSSVQQSIFQPWKYSS